MQTPYSHLAQLLIAGRTDFVQKKCEELGIEYEATKDKHTVNTDIALEFMQGYYGVGNISKHHLTKRLGDFGISVRQYRIDRDTSSRCYYPIEGADKMSAKMIDDIEYQHYTGEREIDLGNGALVRVEGVAHYEDKMQKLEECFELGLDDKTACDVAGIPLKVFKRLIDEHQLTRERLLPIREQNLLATKVMKVYNIALDDAIEGGDIKTGLDAAKHLAPRIRPDTLGDRQTVEHKGQLTLNGENAKNVENRLEAIKNRIFKK